MAGSRRTGSGERLSGRDRAVVVSSIIGAVVVVLIGLAVAGLLVANLGRVRQTTSHPRCKNKLKQLGTALIHYLGEKGGHRFFPFPSGVRLGRDDTDSSGDSEAGYSGKAFLAMIWWTDLVSEAGIFLCPRTRDDNNHGFDLGVRDGQFTEDDIGGIGQVPQDTGGKEFPTPRWQSDDDPAGNHFISYASKGWKVSYRPGESAPSALTDALPSDTIIASDDTADPPNHRNGFNVLYADTRVEFLSRANLCVDEEGGSVGKDPPLDMLCN